ncbi:MAG: hypothetical protein NVV74_01585 [Magnetospirillum sp.]|nr:hypothetical protein [Magnetospirillum sp.]
MDKLEGYEPAALAAAGLIIDAPDLPYPAMPAPPYRPAQGERWRLERAMIVAAPGYFSGPHPLGWDNHLLVRDGVTWMSLVPMEVESQMPHLAAARGTVVVCGLGMGLMAYAVSARRAVERLVVVERDPEVIAMFHQFAAFDSWPQRAKVELVQADACEFRLDGVDFLYADIWPYYRMDCMLADMARMYANIPAARCGYWGQELDMVDWAQGRGVMPADFTAEHVQAFAQAHGLPLIGLEYPPYPGLCRKAAANPAIRRDRVPMVA